MFAQSVNEFRHAVAAFYSNDAVQRANAHTWLFAFQNTEFAWPTLAQLLSQQDTTMQELFVACTTLQNKLAQWSSLEAATRDALEQCILARLVHTTERALLSKFATVFAAIIVNSLAFKQNLFSDFLQHVEVQLSHPYTQPHTDACYRVLHRLRCSSACQRFLRS
jgi:hypothetical protein